MCHCTPHPVLFLGMTSGFNRTIISFLSDWLLRKKSVSWLSQVNFEDFEDNNASEILIRLGTCLIFRVLQISLERPESPDPKEQFAYLHWSHTAKPQTQKHPRSFRSYFPLSTLTGYCCKRASFREQLSTPSPLSFFVHHFVFFEVVFQVMKIPIPRLSLGQPQFTTLSLVGPKLINTSLRPENTK